LREAYPRIEAAGAKLVGVVCQKRSRVERHFAASPLFFPMVCDEDRRIAKRWGVYHRIGVDALHISRPASFVVDGRGIVRFAAIARNQFARVGIEELLGALV